MYSSRSRANPYRAQAPNSLPPSYTVTPRAAPKYPPVAPVPVPIAAPAPRAHSAEAYSFAPNAKDGDGSAQVDVDVDVRQLTPMRTPSPTPSEKYVLTHKSRTCDFKRMFDFKGNPRQILSVALAVLVIVILILFLVFQKRIEEWLRPFADWMHNTPGGWVIPIAIMIVLSFPPLFGHEIVAVLCGDVWGVGIGFGIVAAGTILGELANFFVFKYWCKARGKRTEEKNLKYALLAQVVRDGGFKIPVIMRLSAIPGHLLTAIFSTLGMSLWTFLAAAILGLPKQLVVVYIGVSEADPDSAKKARAIKIAVIVLTVLVTHFAMRYIYRKMDEVKEGVVYRRRKARQEKMLAAAGYASDSVDGTGTGTGTLPKALDADLERAAGVEVINLNAVSRRSGGGGGGGGAPTYSYPESNLNLSVNPNPFGSSMDTVASTATGQGSRGQPISMGRGKSSG